MYYSVLGLHPRGNLLPKQPLLGPLGLGDYGTDVSFDDRSPALADARQVKNGFLNVGSQIQHVHDLRHSGPRDVSQFGELGLVGNGARFQEPIEAYGQCHQTRHARQASRR